MRPFDTDIAAVRAAQLESRCAAAGAPIKEVMIGADAGEILDYIDDGLAWLMIASGSGNIEYNVGPFYKAQMRIDMGPANYGELLPHGVAVLDPDLELTDDYLENCDRLALERLSSAGPQAWQHATLEQKSHRFVSRLSKGDCSAVESINDRHEYILRSVNGLRPKGGREVAQFAKDGVPPGAMLIAMQEVGVTTQGYSASGADACFLHNGRLYEFSRHHAPQQIVASDLRHVIVAYHAKQALEARRSWTVELALAPNRTGIGLKTDAVGAREFVNMMRGNDEAKSRRRALVHWVKEHMRKSSRTDEAASIKVAAHLRGVRQVKAGRYHARIWAAEAEVEAAKSAKHAAQPVGSNA